MGTKKKAAMEDIKERQQRGTVKKKNIKIFYKLQISGKYSSKALIKKYLLLEIPY